MAGRVRGGSHRAAVLQDDDFNFLTEIALGSVYWQAADVGEVLATVERIHDGKAQSWVDEWTATADRLAAAGGGERGGGPGGTRRRASTCAVRSTTR